MTEEINPQPTESSEPSNDSNENKPPWKPSLVLNIVRRVLIQSGHALREFFSHGAGATAIADVRDAFGHIAHYPHLGKVAGGLIVALYFLSGVYIVNPGEEAVVRRFGQVTERRVGEGIHYRLPFPIERVDLVNVSQVRREGIGLRPPEHEVALHPAEETQVLTGDENIVSIKIIVQYKIKDPADYLLRVDSDANPLIRSAVKSALISLGGRATVDDLLTTGRPDLQRVMLANAQKILDGYSSGLQLISINLQEVVPPTQVADAFRNVSSAREEKQATINDAQGYANSVIPKARGEAERLTREAQGYGSQVTSRAQGDAQRFKDVFKEYRQSTANGATDVTRYRYYVETMEQVLAKVKKYIVDPREQNIRIVQ
ncbi:MAG: FtsH protease activity modulator HflK [Chloroflexi bacterium]|nr:FtsH protease activity modulator HflK [Chloroflexota bacterium]